MELTLGARLNSPGEEMTAGHTERVAAPTHDGTSSRGEESRLLAGKLAEEKGE